MLIYQSSLLLYNLRLRLRLSPQLKAILFEIRNLVIRSGRGMKLKIHRLRSKSISSLYLLLLWMSLGVMLSRRCRIMNRGSISRLSRILIDRFSVLWRRGRRIKERRMEAGAVIRVSNMTKSLQESRTSLSK